MSQLQLSKDLKCAGSLIKCSMAIVTSVLSFMYVSMSDHDRDIGESIRLLTLNAMAGKLQMACEKRPFFFLSCEEENYSAKLTYNFKE